MRTFVCLMAVSINFVLLSLSNSFGSESVALNPNLKIISSRSSELGNLQLHHPDISPDGKYIAYSASFSKGNIWVQEIHSGKSWPVTEVDSLSGNWGDVTPRWSPDGKKIFFSSDRGGKEIHVYIVNFDGSNLKRISEKPVSLSPDGQAWDGIGNWMPDGKSVVYSIVNRSENSSVLMEYDLIMEQNKVLHSFSDRITFSPNVSPDGKSIIYETKDNQGFEVIDLDTKHTKIIPCDVDGGRQPRWSPDGEWIAFQRGGSRGWENYIMRKNGSSLTRVAAPELDAQVPSFSADGKSLVYHATELVDLSLMIYDRKTSQETALLDSVSTVGWAWGSWAPNKKLLSILEVKETNEISERATLKIIDISKGVLSETIDVYAINWGAAYKPPAWKNDSSGFYCIVIEDEKPELAHVNLNNFSTDILTQTGTIKHSLALSPDQELLAYVSGDQESQNIWIYDLVLGEIYQATFSEGTRKTQLSFSPEGNYLLFHEDSQTTGMDIMLLEVETNIVSQQTDYANFEFDGQWIDEETIAFTAFSPDPNYSGRVFLRKSLNKKETEHVWGNKNGWVVNATATPKGNSAFYQVKWPLGEFVYHNAITDEIREIASNIRMPIPSLGISHFAYLKSTRDVTTDIWMENIEQIVSNPKLP